MADQLIEHLLRRAGFGASSAELTAYSQLSYTQAVDRLVNYTDIPDTVDSHIGQPGYVNTTSRGHNPWVGRLESPPSSQPSSPIE